MRRHRIWLVVGAAVLLAVFLAVSAVWAATSSGGMTGRPASAERSAADRPGTRDGAAVGRAVPPAPPTQQDQPAAPLPPVGRDLIRSAALTLDVTDLARSTQDIRDTVGRSDGLILNERVHDGGTTLTLQVPADRLDGVLAALGGFGTVAERSLDARDVTEQVVDLQSRMQTQQTSIARIRDLLARASTVGEIVQIESELTSREAELESLQRRLTATQSQVAMSTVKVELRGPAAVKGGFRNGLAQGWNAFLVAGQAVLLALGAALPFLVLAGACVAGFVLVRRRLRARRTAAPAPSRAG